MGSVRLRRNLIGDPGPARLSCAVFTTGQRIAAACEYWTGDMRWAQPLQSAAVRAAIAILLLTPMPAAAQDVTEPALKAAFIYNFAKFTEWPADVMPAGEPLLLCVLGDAAIGEALERAVKGRTLAGHSMGVSQSAPAGPPRGGCHILYVSGVTASQAAKLVAGLRDAPVLTISDVEGFTQLGGIAQFFFEHGQLRFKFTLEAAKRARLQISSRLLALAEPMINDRPERNHAMRGACCALFFFRHSYSLAGPPAFRPRLRPQPQRSQLTPPTCSI